MSQNESEKVIHNGEATPGPIEDGAPCVEVVEPPPQQRWNSPRINAWRTLVACYGLLLMGANDAAYGAIIPYLETYYSLSYIVISIIFISPAVGYFASALIINRVHTTLGQRGVAVISPTSRLVAYIIMCNHPPYPVIVVAFILAGFGNGLEDAAWNAWIGNLLNANEVLGFLHGAYGLGGVLSPLVATAMITRAGYQWYAFMYVMIGAVAIELGAAMAAFWNADGRTFREEHPSTTRDGGGSVTREVLRSRVVWICAAFLLIYVGIEVSLGGWCVSFMMTVRGVAPFEAGISATAFWLGITVGRVILGFVTGRIGEKLAILIYLAIVLALHLVLYLVPSAPVSFVCFALEGFFLGPLFPAAIVAATKILPPHLHVAGIGLAAALGAAGACILPFAVGAIAQSKGVQILVPIVLAFLAADAAVWALLPGLRKGGEKGDGEEARTDRKAGRRWWKARRREQRPQALAS